MAATAVTTVAWLGAATSAATVATAVSGLSGVDIVLWRLLHTATGDEGLLTQTTAIGLYLGLKQPFADNGV